MITIRKKNEILPLIFRDSTPGMATIQTALMHIKLKAAEPTIVPGPKAPDSKLLPTISAWIYRITSHIEVN